MTSLANAPTAAVLWSQYEQLLTLQQALLATVAAGGTVNAMSATVTINGTTSSISTNVALTSTQTAAIFSDLANNGLAPVIASIASAIEALA